jgi:hypothetical protein
MATRMALIRSDDVHANEEAVRALEDVVVERHHRRVRRIEPEVLADVRGGWRRDFAELSL